MMKKKRNIRQRGAADSDEEEAAVPVIGVKSDQIPFLENDYHTQVKQIEKAKTSKKHKEKSEKKSKGSNLLTFDYEEDEGEEVFKVKKSSHSRKQVRKIRERQRQLRDQEAQEPKKEDTLKSSETGDQNKENGAGHFERGIAEVKKEGQRLQVPKKEEDDEDEDEDDDEEQEDIVLNGMAAEAAALAQEDLEEISNRKQFSGFMTGVIPDANLIHAARKKRQQARERGDFIPVDDTQRFQSDPSRLVRDDDNDRSGSDSDEGRMGFTVKHQTNRQRVQEALDAGGLSPKDQSGHGREDQEELERWEQEQIKKGTSVPQAQAGGTAAAAASTTPDPTSYYPQQHAYPQLPDAAYPAVNQSVMYGSAYSTAQDSPQRTAPDALSLPTQLPTVNVETVVKRLKDRLESLTEVHNAHVRESETVTDRLHDAALNSETLRDTQGDVSGQYNFFQEMRGYVRDLIECLDEKVPLISGLETAMLTLLKARASQLLQRRQTDIKDQSGEFTGLSQKAAAAPNMTKSMRQALRQDEEGRQRRAAEREARRSRRRRARQLSTQPQYHNDGTSSDDEETESTLTKFKAERERILSERESVFEDVEDDFCSLPAIQAKFEKWKFGQGDSYEEAYIGLCLPKLFGPFLRLQLLDWNPLQANCPELESFPWYDNLMFFGFRYSDGFDREDSDIQLIPRIVEKTVLPKLTDLVEGVWDPMSTLQTHRLIDTIHQLAEDYPTVSADNKNTQILLKAVVMRIRKTLDNDVYMPLFPKEMIENKASGANAFLQRQFWSCVKLLGNLLSWHGLVAKEQLLELAIDGLLNRYLLLSLNNSDVDEASIAKCERIVSTLPVQWFENLEGDSTLRQLEPLCKYLKYAATQIQQNTGETRGLDSDKRKNRSLIKAIVKQLVNIRAMDHALKMTTDFSLKDIKQMVAS